MADFLGHDGWSWDDLPFVLDTTQAALEAVGGIPGLGEVSDGLNGLISLGRGDYVGAGLSFVSMVPIFGDIVGKGGKITRYAVKYSDEAAVAMKELDNGAARIWSQTVVAPANSRSLTVLNSEFVPNSKFVGNRLVPDGGLPWQSYQRHITGRDYEEMWKLANKNVAVDGRRAGYFVEAKWAGKNDAAWRSSPYNPGHEFYNETKILDQVQNYLGLNSSSGGRGVRYAVSNDAARAHFDSLFRQHFSEAYNAGILRVYHVPGTGM